MKIIRILGALVMALALHHTANANATIISPISATASSTFGGTAFYDIADTINHNGLLIDYVSGVTLFDTYIGMNPLHTNLDVGFEWFSEDGDTTPTIDYDFGSAQNIDGLALWNEEFSGFGTGVVSTSTDGVSFSPLFTITDPTDHGFGNPYAADVFSFAAVSARYVRFELSNCPQPNGSPDFQTCGIGEVAFRAPVPVPAAVWLFGSALLALRSVGRRRIA